MRLIWLITGREQNFNYGFICVAWIADRLLISSAASTSNDNVDDDMECNGTTCCWRVINDVRYIQMKPYWRTQVRSLLTMSTQSKESKLFYHRTSTERFPEGTMCAKLANAADDWQSIIFTCVSSIEANQFNSSKLLQRRMCINFHSNAQGTLLNVHPSEQFSASMPGISDGECTMHNAHSKFSLLIRTQFGCYASIVIRAFIVLTVVVGGDVVAIFTIDPVWELVFDAPRIYRLLNLQRRHVLLHPLNFRSPLISTRCE